MYKNTNVHARYMYGTAQLKGKKNDTTLDVKRVQQHLLADTVKGGR